MHLAESMHRGPCARGLSDLLTTGARTARLSRCRGCSNLYRALKTVYPGPFGRAKASPPFSGVPKSQSRVRDSLVLRIARRLWHSPGESAVRPTGETHAVASARRQSLCAIKVLCQDGALMRDDLNSKPHCLSLFLAFPLPSK